MTDPSFVTYFDQQNELIRRGELQGEEIVVSALMINNGWFDSLIQNKAYIDFATYAPSYGQLQSDAVLGAEEPHAGVRYCGPGGCKHQEEACYAAGSSAGSNYTCRAADDFCMVNVFGPSVGNRDADDLRQNSSTPNPFSPNFYIDFLNLASVKQAIGAIPTFADCSDTPLSTDAGDDARTWLPQPELGALTKLRT